MTLLVPSPFQDNFFPDRFMKDPSSLGRECQTAVSAVPIYYKINGSSDLRSHHWADQSLHNGSQYPFSPLVLCITALSIRSHHWSSPLVTTTVHHHPCETASCLYSALSKYLLLVSSNIYPRLNTLRNHYLLWSLTTDFLCPSRPHLKIT